jgi:hypothetical protein
VTSIQRLSISTLALTQSDTIAEAGEAAVLAGRRKREAITRNVDILMEYTWRPPSDT